MRRVVNLINFRRQVIRFSRMIAVPVTQVWGQTHTGPAWLETALVTATGWKCPQLVLLSSDCVPLNEKRICHPV